jgi:hypothetical protein
MAANGKPVTNAEFQAGLAALKDELVEFMRQIETNLLTEFRKYTLEPWRPPTD